MVTTNRYIFEFLDKLKPPSKFENVNYVSILMEEFKMTKKEAESFQHEWACEKMKNISVKFDKGSTW
tara:strand:- start:276 stop:476 length:201 start_codon:yes stop_codon:yes gene_type:complete